MTELPYSAVEPPDSVRPPNLGHSPSVIWPGYAPSPLPLVPHPTPAHEPHGEPGARAEPGVNAPVSVPEPSALGLFAFGIATLFALRQRSRRQS